MKILNSKPLHVQLLLISPSPTFGFIWNSPKIFLEVPKDLSVHKITTIVKFDNSCNWHCMEKLNTVFSWFLAHQCNFLSVHPSVVWTGPKRGKKFIFRCVFQLGTWKFTTIYMYMLTGQYVKNTNYTLKIILHVSLPIFVKIQASLAPTNKIEIGSMSICLYMSVTTPQEKNHFSNWVIYYCCGR